VGRKFHTNGWKIGPFLEHTTRKSPNDYDTSTQRATARTAQNRVLHTKRTARDTHHYSQTAQARPQRKFSLKSDKGDKKRRGRDNTTQPPKKNKQRRMQAYQEDQALKVTTTTSTTTPREVEKTGYAVTTPQEEEVLPPPEHLQDLTS
jgi:hypothetical protein